MELDIKEDNFKSRDNLNHEISKDLFKLDPKSFADGLVKDCNGDEELALRVFQNYTGSDGTTWNSDVVKELNKMIESKNVLSFNENSDVIEIVEGMSKYRKELAKVFNETFTTFQEERDPEFEKLLATRRQIKKDLNEPDADIEKLNKDLEDINKQIKDFNKNRQPADTEKLLTTNAQIKNDSDKSDADIDKLDNDEKLKKLLATSEQIKKDLNKPDADTEKLNKDLEDINKQIENTKQLLDYEKLLKTREQIKNDLDKQNTYFKKLNKNLENINKQQSNSLNNFDKDKQFINYAELVATRRQLKNDLDKQSVNIEKLNKDLEDIDKQIETFDKKIQLTNANNSNVPEIEISDKDLSIDQQLDKALELIKGKPSKEDVAYIDKINSLLNNHLRKMEIKIDKLYNSNNDADVEKLTDEYNAYFDKQKLLDKFLNKDKEKQTVEYDITPEELQKQYDYKLPSDIERADTWADDEKNEIADLKKQLADPNVSDKEKDEIENRLHKISTEKAIRDKRTNNDYDRVEEAYKTWHDYYGDFGKIKTLLQLGINPNALYTIPWREEHGNSKQVFYARVNKKGDGIIASDLGYTPWKDNSGVYHWKIETKNNRDLTFKEFYDIMHSPLNKLWLDAVESKHGNNYPKMLKGFEQAEENMKNIYFQWYEDNSEDLKGYDADQIAEIFYLWFNRDMDMKSALIHVKNRTVDTKKESNEEVGFFKTLLEDKQITYAKDSVALGKLLRQLGINPVYMHQTFPYNVTKINGGFAGLFAGDKDQQYRNEVENVFISGLPDAPIDDIIKMNKVFLTSISPEGNTKKFTGELDKVQQQTAEKDSQRFANPEDIDTLDGAGTMPDIWEQASSPKAWLRRKDTTPRGEWLAIPQKAIEDVIIRQAQTPQFADTNLILSYKRAVENGLDLPGFVVDAVKFYDPDQQVRYDSRKGVFKIWHSYDNAKAKMTGSNPYRRIMQTFGY